MDTSSDMTSPTDNQPFGGEHRFALMIVIAILISAVLVSISMVMYNSSGAAQLDLSRPGYVNVRDKTVNSDSEFEDYSMLGDVNQVNIDKFVKIYDQQSQAIESADAFSGDPLSLDSLGISTN